MDTSTGATNSTSRATTQYRDALRLKPDEALYHRSLEELLSSRNDLDGDIPEYREAIRLQPDNSRWIVRLADVIRERGNFKGAIAELRVQVRRKSDFGLHNEIGKTLDAKDDLSGAIAEYRSSIKMNPDYAKVHYNLADMPERMGDT